MVSRKQLTEQEVRQKLRDARYAIVKQVAEKSADLADLSIKTVKAAQHGDEFSVVGKAGALTAMTAELQTRYALIDFIDSLNLDTDTGRKDNIKDKLIRRHAGVARSLQRSLTDVSARTGKMAQTCLQNRDQGKLIPFGDRSRKDVTSEHVRLMKDMAIVAFIQSLGVVTNSTTKPDL